MTVAVRDVSDFVAGRQLTRTGGRGTAGRFVTLIGLYAGAGLAGGTAGGVWRLAAWAAQALVILGAYSAMHEAAHRNLFAAPWANRLAGTACGVVTAVDFSLYRAYHLRHHAETSRPADPEPRLALDRGWMHAGAFALGGPVFVASLAAAAFRTALGHPTSYARPRHRRPVAVDLLATVALPVFLAMTAPRWLATWWLVPLVVSYVCLFGATAIPEHHGCAVGGDALATTRTVVSNPVFRFLFWNNNFHAEHHLSPSVPYHRLPELHAFLVDGGRHHHLERSYTRYHAKLARTLWRRHTAPGRHAAAGRHIARGRHTAAG
jgi:fatty acid desaturase